MISLIVRSARYSRSGSLDPAFIDCIPSTLYTGQLLNKAVASKTKPANPTHCDP